MKKHHISPLLGVASSGIINFLLIHFWLADFCAGTADISSQSAYRWLVTLLIAISVWRVINILRDQDQPTKIINRWLDDKRRK